MVDSAQQQVVADVARGVVAQVAPEELPLFRAQSAAYFQSPEKALKGQGGKDEMLGFGGGEVVTFLTPVVLSVTTAVINFLIPQIQDALKTQSAPLINNAVKGLFSKLTPAGSDPPSPAISLSRAQLAQVRQIAVEKGRQLNLSDSQAALLADSLVGSLAVSA